MTESQKCHTYTSQRIAKTFANNFLNKMCYTKTSSGEDMTFVYTVAGAYFYSPALLP